MRTIDQIRNVSPVAAISILAGVVIISLILGATDANDDQVAVQANYCEMQKIYIDSGGDYGWPVLPGYGECK